MSQLFADRQDAGRKLAAALDNLREQRAVILGIPRGGVVVAAEVAHALGADLDLTVARKIGAPGQPELAIGAVTASGGATFNERLVTELEISPNALALAADKERAEANRREQRFRGNHPPAPLAGRTVVIVDDGLATGATMRAAVRAVRQARPAKVIVAVPVGPKQSCVALRSEADEVVCLHELEPFWAVGLHYERFDQTSDEEVESLLAGRQPSPPDKPQPDGTDRRDP